MLRFVVTGRSQEELDYYYSHRAPFTPRVRRVMLESR